MVHVSSKLILLSDFTVGKTENQSQKYTFCIQRNILHLPKMNYSEAFMAYLTL